MRDEAPRTEALYPLQCSTDSLGNLFCVICRNTRTYPLVCVSRSSAGSPAVCQARDGLYRESRMVLPHVSG